MQAYVVAVDVSESNLELARYASLSVLNCRHRTTGCAAGLLVLIRRWSWRCSCSTLGLADVVATLDCRSPTAMLAFVEQ